ncbi:hypothetical protein HK096_004141, partial [Nowakowskiella sp. JEL0078]
MIHSIFETRDAFVTGVKHHYQALGFATKILRSSIQKGKIWIVCDYGGVYHNSQGLMKESRKKETSSCLIDCPFRLTCNCIIVDGLHKWKIIFVLDEHNHEPSDNLIGHPSLCKLPDEEEEVVQTMAST